MESFLADLESQVHCSLCNETMIEPKLLQCFHTLCKLCIKRHAQLDGEVNVFKCPHCTSPTLLEELDNVEDLQISPIHSRILQVLSFVENQKVCAVSTSHSQALYQCLDCNRSLCDECLNSHAVFTTDHKVVLLSDLKKEDIEIMLKREITCETHANQEVELYCRDCNLLICTRCLKDHHNNNHKTTSLQEFITAEKDSLSKNLEEIEKLSTNEEKKKLQEDSALNIKRDGEKAKEQVKKLTKKLVKALVDHEQQLLNEIQKSITKANRNLRIIRHAPAAQEYIEYFIQNGTASEMVEIRDAECSKKFTYNPFVKGMVGMEFKPNEDLCQQVKTGLGLIRSLSKVDPKMSSVKVESNIHAMKKAMLIVVLKTPEGEASDAPLDDVTVQITPEDDVKVEGKHVTTDGQIEVAFTPRVPGQLTAGVQINDNPVSNSPLVIDVKQQIMKENTAYSKLKNALNTGSKSFTGIAVNKTNSKIAVADNSSQCIRVFNMEGDLLLTYNDQGQLTNSQGLAFLNETDLVIADTIKHRIYIVNVTSGKLLRNFGSYGDGNGQFSTPIGVHIDDDSNIIVSDLYNNRIQVFTNNGYYLYQFSVNGRPSSAVTHNGLFYICGYDNSVVHVIEMKDNQPPTTVTTIAGDGQLQRPYSLAIDNDNNLLVCGQGTKMVHKFTLDGRYVGETSQLSHAPLYIAVLNDGQVICTTCGGGVYVF